MDARCLLPIAILAVLLLAGCAATPMNPDTLTRRSRAATTLALLSVDDDEREDVAEQVLEVAEVIRDTDLTGMPLDAVGDLIDRELGDGRDAILARAVWEDVAGEVEAWIVEHIEDRTEAADLATLAELVRAAADGAAQGAQRFLR